jgi:uncharacterized protein (DUF2384 family)
MTQSSKTSVKKVGEKTKRSIKRAHPIYNKRNSRKTDSFGVLQELEANPESSIIIKEILSITNLSLNQLAEYVYEMTPKTLASYRNAGKHLPSRSLEISIKLKQLYAKADELFLNRKDFNSWLHEESYGLGGRVPLNLLNTSSGIDLALEELARIEFGATA